MFNFKKNSLLAGFIERFGVIVITMVLVLIIYVFKFNIFKYKDSGSFFSNILSFASILLGIVITMATLFLGYSNKQVVKKIKLRSADKLMFKYFLLPISTGVVVAISSIILSLVNGENILSIGFQLKLTIIYGAIGSLFFLSTIRVFLLMLLILKDVFDQDMSQQENVDDNINEDVKLNFDDNAFK